MIFARGALLPDGQLPRLLDGLEEELTRTLALPPLPPQAVVSALDALGQELDSGLLDGLIAQYAPPGAREELAQVRRLLRPEQLEYKLRTELGSREAEERPFGRRELRPLGVLLHVAPGNMAGLPLFTAAEGLLTGNINLLKLPREDRGLTPAVLSRLTRAQPALAPFLYAFDLPSSDAASLKRLAALADGVVTWGGDEAVEAMRRLSPPGCKLIEWGHRLSFAYLSGSPDREALAGLADHIVRTGGLLCSSCQVIFLDSPDPEAGATFCKAFLPLLEGAREGQSLPPDQAAQAALYAREAQLEHLVGRSGQETFFPGRGCSLTLRRDKTLELSPLNGNVLVKCLPRGELAAALRPHRGRLQTAGLLCPPREREALTALLLQAGVNRVAFPAHMSRSFPGEGHDGEYPLRRYTRVCDIEMKRCSQDGTEN